MLSSSVHDVRDVYGVHLVLVVLVVLVIFAVLGIRSDPDDSNCRRPASTPVPSSVSGHRHALAMAICREPVMNPHSQLLTLEKSLATKPQSHKVNEIEDLHSRQLGSRITQRVSPQA